MDLTQSILDRYKNLLLEKEAENDEEEPSDEEGETEVDWKRIGNENFAFKRYDDAVRAYTKAIEKGDTSIDLRANRAAVYLALTRYKLALDDVEQALAIDPNHVKCIYRKVNALFGMKLYEEAMAYVQTISLESIPSTEKRVFTELIVKGKSYIAQSKEADYPWFDLYESTAVYHDMADFMGSVTLKDSPMKGRGLFATKTIEEGELILASKAFAYLQDRVPIPSASSNSIATEYSQLDLLQVEINMQLEEAILKVLKENPDKCQELYTLYAGPAFDQEGASTSNLQINHERISSIAQYNRICNYYDDTEDGLLHRNAGIWIYPSFLNHNCVDANSSFLNYGDFLFVRAYRKISVGDEILISYHAPNGLIAQNKLDTYGFICSCRLCERDHLDTKKNQEKRAKLFSQLQELLGKLKDPDIRKSDIKQVMAILKSFDDTRRDAPELNVFLTNELVVFKIDSVPAFFLTAVDVCIHTAVAYVEAFKLAKANYWIKVAKRAARLAYGTEAILPVKYPFLLQVIEKKGLTL